MKKLNSLMMICMAWILMMAGCATTANAKDAGYDKHRLDWICCTYHVQRDRGYNEINTGIGYAYFPNPQVPDVGFNVGAYHNSEGGFSTMIGMERNWKVSKNIGFRLAGGLVTGYSTRAANPYVIPTITLWDRVNIHAVPLDSGGASVSFTLGRW